MKLCITYCSRKKRDGILPPDELYDSPRIDRFTAYCKKRNLKWAILSAKHGLFFPGEKKGVYDVILESDKRCWLGIRVEINGGRLLKEESDLKLKELVETVKIQANNHSVGQVVFYAPNPKRAKAYLALVHFVFDNCGRPHSWQELLECIRDCGTTHVTTQLNFDPQHIAILHKVDSTM